MMSVRSTITPGRNRAAATVAAALSLTLSGCVTNSLELPSAGSERGCLGVRELMLSPPRPSTQLPWTLPRSIFAKPGATLGSVRDRLQSALGRAGYSAVGYYCVRNGFALATTMERIDPVSKTPFPVPARWQTRSPPPLVDVRNGVSLLGIINALRNADAGSYRFLLFYVTDRPVQPKDAVPGATFGTSLITQAAPDLPNWLEDLPFGPSHQVRVLIYEFRRPSVGAEATFVEETQPAASHLEASGLSGLR